MHRFVRDRVTLHYETLGARRTQSAITQEFAEDGWEVFCRKGAFQENEYGDGVFCLMNILSYLKGAEYWATRYQCETARYHIFYHLLKSSIPDEFPHPPLSSVMPLSLDEEIRPELAAKVRLYLLDCLCRSLIRRNIAYDKRSSSLRRLEVRLFGMEPELDSTCIIMATSRLTGGRAELPARISPSTSTGSSLHDFFPAFIIPAARNVRGRSSRESCEGKGIGRRSSQWWSERN